MYKILVSNDDGIQSPGIKYLVKALEPLATVYVVAPEEQQSAKSRSVSALNSIKATEIEMDGAEVAYTLSGTPSDCVLWGLERFMEFVQFDFVISGINRGENTASSIYYSGTLGAACEGALYGVRSIALSVNTHAANEFEYICDMLPELLEMSEKLSPEIVLNVNAPNLPKQEVKGVKLAEQAPNDRGAKYSFEELEDGEYRLVQMENDFEHDLAEDYSCVMEGYVSITPLRPRMFDEECLDELRGALDAEELFVFLGAQEKTFEELSKSSKVGANLAKLAKCIDRLDKPVLIAEHYGKGRTLGAIIKNLSNAEYVQTLDFDLSKCKDFKNLMNTIRSNRVYLAGASTNIDIYQTAESMLNKGYKVTVIADCCAASSKSEHVLALEELRAKGCEILGLEAAIMKLIASSAHPAYRSVTNILN